MDAQLPEEDATQLETQLRNRVLDQPQERDVDEVAKLMTALARAQEESRCTAERFRTLAQLAFEGIVFDKQGQIVDCNEQFAAILGYTRQELFGRELTEFLPSEEQELVRRIIRERQQSVLDLHARRKDGTWRVVEVHGRVLAEATGLGVAIVRDVTERNEAEEALRRSEARLGGIVNSAMDAIISIDERQRIVLFNPAAEKLFGVKAEEVLGDSINRFIPERYRAAHGRHVEEFGRTGVTNRALGALGTLWGVRANGEEFPIEASISQVALPAGKLFTVTLRDVTEQKRAEARARLWLRVFEAADFGLAYTNARDNTLLAVNASFARQRGYTPEELQGQPLFVVYAPEVRETIKQRLVEIDATGHLVYESVHQRKDGSRFPVLMEVTVIRDATGQPESRVSYALDITEQKATEAALRQSEERFRTMADAMPQLAWMAQPDGRIVWYNRRCYEYTGLPPEQAEGWGWQQVLDPQTGAGVLEQWRKALASGEPLAMEVALRGADGVFHPFLTRAIPLKDEHGQVLWWFGTSTDIQDIVAARETLARSREELERLVRARTAQLVEANANLQNFAYTAAHDLRAPLRGIASFSQLLAEQYRECLDEMGRGMLERMADSVNQMTHLLNDLLEYSKVTQGDLWLEKLSLEAAVREGVALLESDIRTRQAEVSVATALPEVIGHSATVAMVVSNLVSNGLKFMPEGVKPRLRLWAERRDVERGSAGVAEPEAPQPGHAPHSTLHAPMVRLWVEDNGIGIAPEDQEKVFGAFQRLHGKGTYPGTGLGLAIVRKGVERMGGQVGLESELGKGSRFWVELRSG